MNATEISKIVADHLTDQPSAYLREIVAHGIHNLTNEFSDCDEYDAIADEFSVQAGAALARSGCWHDVA